MTGQGVPPGGTQYQQLVKVDGVDFNTQWLDTIVECASATEEAAAFAAGSTIVIRTDLI